MKRLIWRLCVLLLLRSRMVEQVEKVCRLLRLMIKSMNETEFEKYRVIQDRLFMSDFDKYMLELEENAKK